MRYALTLLSLWFSFNITAQHSDFCPATLYLKDGSVLVGKAKVPLQGKTLSYQGKESVRFVKEGEFKISKYDETTLDSLFLEVTHSFKIKEGKKRTWKSLIKKEKYLYKPLGMRHPQLVREVSMGNLTLYEKMFRVNRGGQLSGIVYWYDAHMFSSKGLTSFGHLFYCDSGSEILTLLPKPDNKHFIYLFSNCPSLINAYEASERKLHPVEVSQLLENEGSQCELFL